jgi:hypothetical protein
MNYLLSFLLLFPVMCFADTISEAIDGIDQAQSLLQDARTKLLALSTNSTARSYRSSCQSKGSYFPAGDACYQLPFVLRDPRFSPSQRGSILDAGNCAEESAMAKCQVGGSHNCRRNDKFISGSKGDYGTTVNNLWNCNVMVEAIGD